MPEFKRTVNRKYLDLLFVLQDLNLGTLGERISPPLTRAGVCKMFTIGDKCKPEDKIKQVAEILGVSDVHIFPWEPVAEKEIVNSVKV
jgi:hypothetical protein